MGDTTELLGSTKALTESMKNLQPIVGELPTVETKDAEVAHESRLLVKEVQPFVPSPEQVARLDRTLETANGLMKNASALIGEVQTMTAKGANTPLGKVARRVDTTMSRALAYLIALGAIWSILWWGGYVLARRVSPRVRREPWERAVEASVHRRRVLVMCTRDHRGGAAPYPCALRLCREPTRRISSKAVVRAR
jgi:hypothetical protein